MEVATADIQKRLVKPYTVVLRSSKQELTTRIDIYSDVLRDGQRSNLGGMIEFGYRPSGLLEIRRFWFVKYNKPVFMHVPKEANDILRKAKNIIIPKEQQPDFIKNLKTYLAGIQTQEPRTVPTCQHCLREDRLTVLTRRNAVKISADQVTCLSCGQSDLKAELRTLGIKMSRAMMSQLERQVSRVKSVPRLVDMLTPGFDPTRETDLTLIDTVVAQELSTKKDIQDLPIPDNFKSILLDLGLETLLPIQEKTIQA